MVAANEPAKSLRQRANQLRPECRQPLTVHPTYWIPYYPLDLLLH